MLKSLSPLVIGLLSKTSVPYENFKKKDIQGLFRFETMAWNEMLLITCISLKGNDLILIRLLSQLKRNLEDYI